MAKGVFQLSDPAALDNKVAERLASPESYAQVRNTTLPNNMPLIVLSAENAAWARRNPPSFVGIDEAHTTWMALQQEQAKPASNNQWIIVLQSVELSKMRGGRLRRYATILPSSKNTS